VRGGRGIVEGGKRYLGGRDKILGEEDEVMGGEYWTWYSYPCGKGSQEKRK